MERYECDKCGACCQGHLIVQAEELGHAIQCLETEASMAVAVTRTDHSAEEFRRLASTIRDAEASRCMLAIALALEGANRTTSKRRKTSTARAAR